MLDRHFLAAWLQRLAGLLALLGVLTLAACGGGSGPPAGNPYAPPPPTPPTPDPLVVLPKTTTIPAGVPTALSISGGTPPFRAFSSNTAVLPVAQAVNGSTITLLAANVTADTKVTITVQDSGTQTATADVTVAAGIALGLQPSSTIAYSGVPTVLTVNGGAPPYRAFSSNSAVLPVAQSVNGNSIVLLAGNVTADTPVTITVQDATSQAATADVTVRAAALLNTFTVTPNFSDCGTAVICSGQTGVASVTVLAPGGGTAAGRQVRFEVVSGPFSILTNNPAQPTASTITVVTDAAGVAQVVVRANVDAPTQPAMLRATDLTSGQQRTAQFLVLQNTNGQSILSVVPPSATINGVFKNECSSGVPVDYYIYGGTPPYRVTASFPTAVTILNAPVTVAGGFFEAVTNGACTADPGITFSILDATGRQTTATLQNLPGNQDRPGPTPIPALAIAPNSVAAPTCAGRTFNFVAAGGGGTRFARVSPQTVSGGTTNPQVSGVDGAGNFVVTFGPGAVPVGSTYTVTLGDAVGSTPVTATITCTNG